MQLWQLFKSYNYNEKFYYNKKRKYIQNKAKKDNYMENDKFTFNQSIKIMTFMVLIQQGNSINTKKTQIILK